jgi:hypothetical protein
MKADLTRRTFNPLKHFTRVLMQQGRVQLDADWNEQTAVLLHNLRTLAADLIGPHGGPDGDFAVPPTQPFPYDFVIGAGHYYVDGILCEADSEWIPITVPEAGASNKVKILYWPQDGLASWKNQYVEVELSGGASLVQVKITDLDPANRTLTLDPAVSTPARVRHLNTYMKQPDYPVPVKEEIEKNTQYLVYLDVWERLVTYVEDDSIREVALNGPDTAARSKVVWQVKIIAAPQAGCNTVLKDLFQWENRGWLKAMAKQESNSTDPCVISPDARYRGAENQLYRVEIHAGGTIKDKAPATFKWSRENGSVIYPIITLAPDGGTMTVTLENLGRDDRFGLAEGDYVEIVDDDYVLQNRAEPLLKVHSIDRPSMTVTLDGALISTVGQDPSKHPLLRRWDHTAGEPDEGGLKFGNDNAALIVEDTWLELEDGIKIQFQKPDNLDQKTKYRTSDYWLIPARTATGDVEWPRDQNNQPIASPLDGVMHHYAPLAVISVGVNGAITLDGSCQKSFPSMTTLANK